MNATPVTTDAPPVVQYMFNETAKWMNRRGFNIKLPVSVKYADQPDETISIPSPWASAQPGNQVYLYPVDQQLTLDTANYVYYNMQHPVDFANAVAVVIHELYHLNYATQLDASGLTFYTDWIPVERYMEEGLADSMAVDLYDAWCYKFDHNNEKYVPKGTDEYLGAQVSIRKLSAAATHTKWNSFRAIQWRIRFAQLSPDIRFQSLAAFSANLSTLPLFSDLSGGS